MKSFIEGVLFRTLKRKFINKRLKIMATLMMLIVSFNSFANKNLYSQTEITLDLKNTTIIGVLDYIESTTELRFIFDSDIYDLNKKVSILIKNKNLDQTPFRFIWVKSNFPIKRKFSFFKRGSRCC